MCTATINLSVKLIDTKGPQVQITEKDFDGLTAVSMEWGDTWRSKKGRFSMWEGETLSFQWGMAYWFSDYPSVFLAKQFFLFCFILGGFAKVF